MRRIHETALLIGMALLWAALSWRVPPPPPIGWFVGATVVICFALSTVLALIITLRPREASLPTRTVFSYLFSVTGLSFLMLVALNDLWLPLSYPHRFLLLISLTCFLFVVPWVSTEFRILHRTPLAFDAALSPILAAFVHIGISRLPLSVFWSPTFWLVFGLPAILITFFVMRSALRRGRNTLLPLGICTVILCFVLAGIPCG